LQKIEGSEVHCLELAEYFLQEGYEVDVASFKVGNPMKGKFEQIGIDIKNLRKLKTNNYDLVWSHHRTTFYFLHCQLKIKSKYFIHQMLSPFLELEYFPLFSDSKIDDRLYFFANSRETRSLAMRQSGDATINLLHNSIPDVYFTFKSVVSQKNQIKRIGVISNHPPIELRAAMELFSKNGVSVSFYGNKDTVVEVTPNLLEAFDLIVTIGKTVQYCFACSVPVYNYDHHGGGYISYSKLDDLEFFNFSGRFPGTLKSPEFIFHEITSGYLDAVKDLPKLKEEALSRYRLNTQLHPFLTKFNYKSEPRQLLDCHNEDVFKEHMHRVIPKEKKFKYHMFFESIKKVVAKLR